MPIVAALVALSGCAGSPPTNPDDLIVQRAVVSFAKHGVEPSDIKIAGMLPFYGYNGRALFYYVWLRTGSCKGWYVQRADHPADMFTMGECEMRTHVDEHAMNRSTP